MGQGIGGGLPGMARKFQVVAHYNGTMRGMRFTVESHIERDVGPKGKVRIFRNIERAQARADQLNRGAP